MRWLSPARENRGKQDSNIETVAVTIELNIRLKTKTAHSKLNYEESKRSWCGSPYDTCRSNLHRCTTADSWPPTAPPTGSLHRWADRREREGCHTIFGVICRVLYCNLNGKMKNTFGHNLNCHWWLHSAMITTCQIHVCLGCWVQCSSAKCIKIKKGCISIPLLTEETLASMFFTG